MLPVEAFYPRMLGYLIFHHSSSSCIGLQVVDYCNWAIYRKWSRHDSRSYNMILPAIASEFDIFRTGGRHYY